MSQHVILVDPLLGGKGKSAPPFSFFRSKPQKNPIVELPKVAHTLLRRVTHCLITHLHPDHLDKAGMLWLKEHQIPTTCSVADAASLKRKGINVVQSINYWEKSSFLGGKIVGIPAKHGYGFVAKPMGKVMGFFMELPDQQSIYLSSDTIYTKDVEKVLTQYQPAISVLACGGAQFDLFKPLLMNMDDIIRFIKTAPGKVVANHLEAIDHCPITRKELAGELVKHKLSEKVFIPNDGEELTL